MALQSLFIRWLLAAVLAAAPLLRGSVHRPACLAVVGTVTLLLALLLTARPQVLAADWVWPSRALLLLMVLPLVQLLPLPPFLLSWTNHASATLSNTSRGWRPLSLDPPSTAAELARSASAFGVLLAARRYERRGSGLPIAGVLALSGLAALLFGIVHRILFDPQQPGTPFLSGPFINPNHNAEVFELAAFCAFAMSSRSQGPARLYWGTLGSTLVAATLATLSRGGAVAVAAGTVFWFVVSAWSRLRDPDSHSARYAPLLGVTLIIASTAVGLTLGAESVLTELLGSSIKETKFSLWVDSLRVLKAHPIGVGRGAFERAYTLHQTVSQPIRFQYVENLPLQLLIDVGWVGFLAVAATAVAAAPHFIRRARDDSARRLICAGIVAVLAHNLVDFGFETLGIRLPLAAALAAVLPASRGTTSLRFSSGMTERPRVIFAFLCSAAGFAYFASPAARDYDRDILRAPTAPTRLRAAKEGARWHPFDYYYPLNAALAAPLVDGSGTHSPRLAYLNEALALCPRCASVHAEAARSLWQLNRPRQSLEEWNRAIADSDYYFFTAFDALTKLGATLDVWAHLVPHTKEDALFLADQLAAHRAADHVDRVLELARTLGSDDVDALLVRSRLARAQSDPGKAASLLLSATRLAPQRAAVYKERATLATAQGQAGEALELANRAAALAPADAEIAALVVNAAATRGDNDALVHAVDRLKRTADGKDVVGTCVAAARAYASIGNASRAIAEYRTAATQADSPSPIWHELAAFAESQGQTGVALEAYRRILRRDPADTQTQARLRQLLAPTPGDAAGR